MSSVTNKCGNVIDNWEVEVTPGGQRTAALNNQWLMLKHIMTQRVVLELMSSVANKCGNVIDNWEAEVTQVGSAQLH